MYLSILILPLLGSLVSGLLGRKVGVTGSHIITCTCLILSSILATLAFYEVGICGSPVSIYLGNWVDSEIMSISWEFLFDQLTVSMLLVYPKTDLSLNKKPKPSTPIPSESRLLHSLPLFPSPFYIKKNIFFFNKKGLGSQVQGVGRVGNFDFNSFYKKYAEIYPNLPLPPKEFLEWFIGFAEGDGCFTVQKRGDLSFIVIQSTKDVQVLNYIKQNLGFGTVRVQSAKLNTHKFVVQDFTNIYLLCLLCNGNMVLPTRSARFLIFLSSFNEKLLRKNLTIITPITETILPTLSDCWLLGFVDSEGCFTVSFLSTSNAFRFSFIITQKWVANQLVLEHIGSLFNCHSAVRARYNNSDYLDLKINGLENCKQIFPYFDKYGLKSFKKDSYLKWKHIHYKITLGDHLNELSRKELINLWLAPQAVD